MHATGRYPDWWQGRRFDRPIVAWACGVTSEVVRDTVQRVLVGRQGSEGTGIIPKDCHGRAASRRRGIADLLDSIKVRHVSGEHSVIGLKTYASGPREISGRDAGLRLVRRGAAGRYLHRRPDPHQRRQRAGVARRSRRCSACPRWCAASCWSRRRIVMVVHMTIDDVGHYSAEEKTPHHRQLSGARAGGPHQGHPDAGLWPHLPGRGGD